MTDLAAILAGVAAAASAASPFLPGAAQPALAAVAAAVALAADLARAGRDPVVEIARIRRVHPMLAKVEEAWDARLKQKFEDDGFYDPEEKKP